MIELQISKNLIFMAGIQEGAKTRPKVRGLNLCRPCFLADKLGKISSLFCTFGEYVVRELVKVVEKAGRGPLATRVKGAATPLEW